MDLFRKHGFVEAGIKREWIKTSDGYLDEHMFQLLNDKNNN
jgi:L-amino acid N-acyltransferase YncA